MRASFQRVKENVIETSTGEFHNIFTSKIFYLNSKIMLLDSLNTEILDVNMNLLCYELTVGCTHD